jgi:hypothetical protein
VASTQTPPWYRIFVPTIADAFFVSALMWLFALGAYGWQGLLQDGDVGTHIRIGDYILSHHSVPSSDFLSFSKPGQPWYAFEWLTEVLFSWLHGVAGLKGVVLLAGVVIAATFTIVLMHTLWRGANVLFALALTLMAVNASDIHFHARPHIFTMLFAAMAMWLIDADRRRRTRALWLLVPITVLWTNLHGGFLALFAILGLLVVGSLIESFLWNEFASSRKSDALRYGLLGAACAGASLLNPYGIKLHLFIREYLSSDTIRNGVQEFQSPSFRSESMFHYMFILFLALALTAPLLKKRRLAEVLWIWFWAYNSLVSVRHVPLFLIVTVPIVAAEVTSKWNQWVQTQPARSIVGTLQAVTTQGQCGKLRIGLWAPAVVVALALSHSSNWPENFLDGSFPVKIVEKHAGEIAASRVYTSDKWAGYLIYKNYPRQRVFFDDRHQYFGDAIIRDYIRIGAGSPDWRKLLDSYSLNMALCPADSPLSALLKIDPDWKVADGDGKIILFRRSQERPSL